MRILRAALLLVLAAALLTLAACGGAPASGSAGQPKPGEKPKELKEVSLRLDWLLGAEHTAYYVAQEKGFFADAGLKVNIREGEGSGVTVKLIGNGNDTFGVVAAGTVLLSVAEGIPVQSVATLFQNTPTAVIFPKDKPIKSLTDLKGKQVGVLIKSVTYTEWQAMEKMQGLDPKSVTEVAMDRAIVEPMMSKKIDAGIAWMINDGTQLQVNGFDVGLLPFKNLGLQIPSSTIVANSKDVAKNPELVKAFVGAVLKGWQYTIDHPDEAFEIFKKNAPKADVKFNQAKLPMVIDLLKSDKGLGYNNPAAWENLKKLYSDFGVLKSPVDLNQVYTNNFLAK